ncbi:MAG: glucokinase [bacterium]|nr:glucokinase [bacterium]MDT8396678.1 glucokinase [bacterium]
MIMAGDIGATKTILALFNKETGPGKTIAEAVFPSGDYPGLEEIASEFLSHAAHGIPTAACFGVAGPVVNGQANITNLSWNVSVTRLRSILGIPHISLINDVQAVGYSIGSLDATDLKTINEGRPVKGGAKAIIAPGTGLGEAILLWDGRGYRCYPTEGSHADFAPADEQQVGLLRHVGRKFGHVSWERVCSGIGISNLYDYLKATGDYEEPDWLKEKLAVAIDPVPEIFRGAMEADPPAEVCRTTVKMFVSILGAEAGNLALKTLATGGIYIGGGIAPRVLDLIIDGTFMESFTNKGRLAGLLRDIPVRIVMNPRAALMGAAVVGLGMEG